MQQNINKYSKKHIENISHNYNNTQMWRKEKTAIT